MSWNTHRPRGRFFNGQKLEVMVWLLAAPLSWMMWLAVGVVQIAHAQTGPATTLVSDTVYRGRQFAGAGRAPHLVAAFHDCDRCPGRRG